MKNESEIIPIEHSEQEEAIRALVLARRSYTPERLALMAEEEIAETLRDYYRQASGRGLVVLLNLAIRTLGQEAGAGVFEWRDCAPIVATYDAGAGTTRITSGELVVLSNEQAGRELLRPGKWLHRLCDAYRLRSAEAEWWIEIDSNRRREKAITDFSADV